MRASGEYPYTHSCCGSCLLCEPEDEEREGIRDGLWKHRLGKEQNEEEDGINCGDCERNYHEQNEG